MNFFAAQWYDRLDGETRLVAVQKLQDNFWYDVDTLYEMTNHADKPAFHTEERFLAPFMDEKGNLVHWVPDVAPEFPGGKKRFDVIVWKNACAGFKKQVVLIACTLFRYLYPVIKISKQVWAVARRHFLCNKTRQHILHPGVIQLRSGFIGLRAARQQRHKRIPKRHGFPVMSSDFCIRRESACCGQPITAALGERIAEIADKTFVFKPLHTFCIHGKQ